MALLADGELDDLAELRDTLVGLRKRRAALEAELAAAGAGATTPVNVADLRAWALRRLDELGSALATGNADELLRQVVQAYVISIDIDPEAKRGVLLLPADAVAILERDALALSRVKPADAGFTAIKNAFLASGLIALKILDKAGGQGPDGDFAITSFSRNEALEEAITVSVTAKLAVFRSWIEGT